MTAPAPQSQPGTIELMAREADAEIARITGLLFDEINKNKELTKALETARKAIWSGGDTLSAISEIDRALAPSLEEEKSHG